MRTYKARVYSLDRSDYFDVRILADDYWDARRRLDAQYPGHQYAYLTEA